MESVRDSVLGDSLGVEFGIDVVSYLRFKGGCVEIKFGWFFSGI